MTAINFPNNPAVNDTYTFGNITYQWDGNSWLSKGPAALGRAIISTTAPSNPDAGELWYDSSVGVLRIYYNDGSSAQWVDAVPMIPGPTGPAGPTGPTGPSGTFVDVGTKMIAVQTSAPTGWTKDATHNDKALRLVTGTASTGGSTPFTTAFASQTPAGTISSDSLIIAQLASHTHDVQHSTLGPTTPFIGGGANTGATTPAAALATGSGSTHTHTFTGTAINFAVNYVDCIIITKS